MKTEGLKIMQKPDGALRSPYWYARFTRNGQKTDVSLVVAVRGTPPVNADGRIDLAARGDEEFEASRKAALAALAKMKEEARLKGRTAEESAAKDAELARRYFRARTGRSVKTKDTPLADLPKLWRGLARTYTPTAAKMRYYDGVFAAFARFAAAWSAAHGFRCDSLSTITRELAVAYFDDIRKRYAWETTKGQMSLLGGAFDRWGTGDNPFSEIIKRNHGTEGAKVHKKPLAEEELARLFDLVAEKPALARLVDVAACTGMRLGDCCNLSWADVDERNGLVSCITSKTGERAWIPIFPRLAAMLKAVREEQDAGEALVLPAWAERYNHLGEDGTPDRRDGIVQAIKPYLALAVFGDPEEQAKDATPEGEKLAPEQILARIEAAPFAPSKKARVADTYRRFAEGASYAEITEATGRPKAVVSQDLEIVENLVGQTVRPGNRAKGRTKRDLVRMTRASRTVGAASASLYGWHSFRTAFVTIALQYGVPIEDVRKIVGHSSVRMTEDYNRTEKKHAAERVKRQMAGSVLDGAKAVAVTETIEAGDAVAATTAAPARALKVALAVLGQGERQTVDAVLAASGLDAAKEPARAFAVLAAVVNQETRERLANVCRAAGIVL